MLNTSGFIFSRKNSRRRCVSCPKLNFIGVNLTAPHKSTAHGLMDALDERAQRIGAINTVSVDGEKLVGWNTDGFGFARAIRSEFSVDLRDLRVMVLGAGGGPVARLHGNARSKDASASSWRTAPSRKQRARAGIGALFHRTACAWASRATGNDPVGRIGVTVSSCRKSISWSTPHRSG